jgi:hypothetical protein
MRILPIVIILASPAPVWCVSPAAPTLEAALHDAASLARPSRAPKHLIVSTARFNELGYEPGVTPFRYGVYAFRPAGWVVASGHKQSGTTLYPPLSATNGEQARAEAFLARSAAELTSLFKKKYDPNRTRTVIWITHGYGVNDVSWFDGVYDDATAASKFRALTSLDPGTRLIIKRCYMDERGAITPAQVYVQDIWPFLMKDEELRHPPLEHIPIVPSSGGTITRGGKTIIVAPDDP